jgi:hypothetical protein
VTAVGDDYDGRDEPIGVDEAPGLVDFTTYTHLDHPDIPDAALANIGCDLRRPMEIDDAPAKSAAQLRYG